MQLGKFEAASNVFLRQGGLTLIEILIAVLVLSIGLVGLATLHVNSMKYAHSSYYSSIATSIALDLEERLWIRAATSVGTCLSSSDIEGGDDGAGGILSEMNAAWIADTAGGATGTVTIPGLEIDNGEITTGSADPDDPDSVNRWVQVPVTVRWTDERVSEDGMESFNYVARVACFTGDVAEDESEEG